jgi:hypothetical protein
VEPFSITAKRTVLFTSYFSLTPPPLTPAQAAEVVPGISDPVVKLCGILLRNTVEISYGIRRKLCIDFLHKTVGLTGCSALHIQVAYIFPSAVQFLFTYFFGDK